MVRDTSNPTRGELAERKEHNEKEIQLDQEKLRETTDDIRKIRRLIEQLDPGGGTSEGRSEVAHSAEGAEHVTENVFDRQDQDLDEANAENDAFSDETRERGEVMESNVEKLGDAGASIETSEALSEIERAKEAALRDIDILNDLVEQAIATSDRSRQIADDLRQIRRRDA